MSVTLLKPLRFENAPPPSLGARVQREDYCGQRQRQRPRLSLSGSVCVSVEPGGGGGGFSRVSSFSFRFDCNFCFLMKLYFYVKLVKLPVWISTGHSAS